MSSSGMNNFRAYNYADFRALKGSIVRFYSDHREILAHRGRSLHVSLHNILHVMPVELNLTCLAGNSSLCLITNRGLFEAVFPTDGLYGFVMIDTSL